MAAESPLKASKPDKARIAITLDLEMSRHYPTWEQTHWDYEKGNLDADTKRYSVEAARRVKAAGGRIHFFAVGRVFEQENVDWLKEIVAGGHPVGNHTYDHVYVLAAKSEELQFRFQRAPWLIRGKQPREVIAENIRLTNDAMETRLGIKPAGFRTPGGFSNGLADRPDVQQMMLDLGFRWVSSKYPAHPNTKPGEPPSSDVLAAIVKAQQQAQPFRYASGLVEAPMSPISDVGAFRSGRWKLEHFLKAVRLAVQWAIENRAAFDFLGHPSCLVVEDPQFKTVELICELVHAAGDAAAIVSLDEIAATVPPKGTD
jgi:peptidoglycan/xylan/chitin deacetylase (PgdA/CDA1 family)